MAEIVTKAECMEMANHPSYAVRTQRLARAYMEAMSRNERLEHLLGEAAKAVIHVSGPSHSLALEIAEALSDKGERLRAYHGGSKA